MKKLVLAIPSSHAWMWLQTCVASLLRNPPKANGVECEIVVVNNSPWSPAIRGLTDTSLSHRRDITEYPSGVISIPTLPNISILENYKSNKFHASALDCIVEKFDFDYLMAWETDVLALRPTWLEWFMSQLKPTDYGVGHWHHERFLNPSCTLYRGDVLRKMLQWCKTECPQDCLRWGPRFENESPLDNNLPLSENPAEVLRGMKEWICGPFAEKRGWPAGTVLKEGPSGQHKNGGWYEPGQQLHHWAVEAGYTYTVCPTSTTHKQPGMPIQTFYGTRPDFDPGRQLEYAEMATIPDAQTVHLWGGTRALDILKHPVTCQFVAGNTAFWLEREARFWRDSVPADVQAQTLDLFRRYGFHYRGQGSDHVSDRDREAAEFVKNHYRGGGVNI